jgi:hypothetical protein
MCDCTLAEHSPEEEENGATSPSLAFPCGVPAGRKAMFAARKAEGNNRVLMGRVFRCSASGFLYFGPG